MSEYITPEQAVGDAEVKAQAERVSRLLRELEGLLDANQHSTVTELLAERAVLTSMRTRAELDELKKAKAPQTPKGGETL